MMSILTYLLFFFFNYTAPPELYTLSLHDALPISSPIAFTARTAISMLSGCTVSVMSVAVPPVERLPVRSEEHTSELQSHVNLVCRLLLEKKKKLITRNFIHTASGRVGTVSRLSAA